ncbi:flavodoxin family protein [Planococcus lenghuensis]|uniref:BRAMP protein n=1 Tax=Planococcus lenghuensis TaxID=2213202 RepID=A0A1Q2L3M7_9BACL|nr:flavodoxin family protein [Planococcus lenghuensis]AQQ55065.1 BRAMP protein [Planococcus lenghuensis]
MRLKALVLNCTLKKSPETSNTEALINETLKFFDKEGVPTEVLRLADYNIAHAMKVDAGEGDDWPKIHRKVLDADILIVATPIWMGEKSSYATKAIERIYAGSSDTNDKGQYIYYNKVAGAIVTGNEDGAKDSAKSILYGLGHMGFTIPPNVDTYWVGQAGPGPSFIEAEGQKNSFTMQHAKIMAYNLIHFARMFKQKPIPSEGTVIDQDKQNVDK